MGTVPARVDVGATNEVGSVGSTAAKFLVVDAHTRVDNVGEGATASRVIIAVLGEGGLPAGDAAQAPLSVVLGNKRSHVAGQILLDECDL